MPFGLEADVWLYAAGAAFVLTHLAVLLYLARRNLDPSRGSVGRAAQSGAEAGAVATREVRPARNLPPIDGDRIVRCPHCSVENAAEFRFCRYCVGELTGGATVSKPGSASRDGQAF